MASPPSAPEFFGSIVTSYDSLIRRAVPRYEEMTAKLLDYLPDAAGDVLELGCGTGNLTVALRRKYPAARLTVVDAAPEMLAVARARAGGDVRTVEARFEDLDLAAASFDLVTSCISLHHVEGKGPLYAAIGRALRPGGAFCFADQLAGGSERNHRVNWERWLEFCREPGHCTEEEVASLLEHAERDDHYTPLAEQLELLGGAGFQRLDCVWRHLIWGIVTAEKPP